MSTNYYREVLVDVLVYHYRAGIEGCGCGWAELGSSWPEHVATVYEGAALQEEEQQGWCANKSCCSPRGHDGECDERAAL